MRIRCFRDLDTLSLAAAGWIVGWARRCVKGRGLFTWVLSGGETPRPVYERLSSRPLAQRMPWPETHIFWGDERCVPQDHPQSNFRMAFESLISRAPLPSQNIHRIQAEDGPPQKVAEDYEQHLQNFFKPACARKVSEEATKALLPSFDLIMLGLGKDGHTASLFPGERAIEECKRWVTAVRIPRGTPRSPRITITFPVINNARVVMMIATGAQKREIIRSLFSSDNEKVKRYPVARVDPAGRMIWWLDQDACPWRA